MSFCVVLMLGADVDKSLSPAAIKQCVRTEVHHNCIEVEILAEGKVLSAPVWEVKRATRENLSVCQTETDEVQTCPTTPPQPLGTVHAAKLTHCCAELASIDERSGPASETRNWTWPKPSAANFSATQNQ